MSKDLSRGGLFRVITSMSTCGGIWQIQSQSEIKHEIKRKQQQSHHKLDIFQINRSSQSKNQK
jgi:hypothetical protein